MEKLIEGGFKDILRPTGDKIGRAHRIDDATGRYVQFLKGSFPSNLNLDGIRLVVDCANGAGYKVAPTVFEELGAEVIELGTHPDGTNINENCGSLHPEKMCELVVKTGANAGIALDGDADRVIMCDEKGSVLDGDVMMALSAIDLNSQGRLNHKTVVATVMSNLALDPALKQHGINVVRTGVGDRYVIGAMRESGYNFGGEQSGHMIFLDHNTTGDGMLGGLSVLAVMIRQEKPLSEIAKVFEPYPQVQMNVDVVNKQDFMGIPEIKTACEKFKGELGSNGRLLMRYSGTQNVARVMVEGPKHETVRLIAEELAGLISTHLK
jgi:phosphoglucosamine mutase